MKFRSRYFALLVILMSLLLNACGPDANASPGEDGMEGPAATFEAGAGSATVYYHYKFKTDLMNFKIEPVIPLVISDSETPGSHVVEGIAETWFQIEMMGRGGAAGTCLIQCQMILRFVAEGKIELDENGDCKIPMSFHFQPDPNESILTGSCPDPAMDTMSCGALSAVMMDPYIYTFTKGNRNPVQPSDPEITLRAEIRDVNMPPGVDGICNW